MKNSIKMFLLLFRAPKVTDQFEEKYTFILSQKNSTPFSEL
ncbi:hypothetical protein D1AOALGA4SA_3992 [Olavius algarvensis Delta 1 endosymbiont]|nr:hypothetical protein D1AOALGA4SA_3992 [Olavius algarvensis Delta 1 endosymbiont]